MINIILGEIVILLVNFYIMSQLIRYTRKQMQARKASIFAKEALNQERYNTFAASPESVLYCLYFFCGLGLLICGCLQALLVFEAEYATLIKLSLFTAVTCAIDILVYYLLVSDTNMHTMVDNIYKGVAVVIGMCINVLGVVMLMMAIILPVVLYGVVEEVYFSVAYLSGITLVGLFSIGASASLSAACLYSHFSKTQSNYLCMLRFFPAVSYLFMVCVLIYYLPIYQVTFFTTTQIMCMGSILSGILLAPEVVLYLHKTNITFSHTENKILAGISALQLSCKYVAIVVFFVLLHRINGVEMVGTNLLSMLHKILQHPAWLVSLLLASSFATIYFIILEIIKIVLQRTYFPHITTAGKHDAP